MNICLVTANLDFNTGVDKDRDHLNHLLTALYTSTNPPAGGLVVCTQETKNLRLAAVLATIGRRLRRAVRLPVPQVTQGRSQARAGTAIAAYGIKLYRPRLFLGGTSRGILPRWVTRASIRLPTNTLELHNVHIQPPRSGTAAQNKYLRRVRRRLTRAERRGHGWAVCGDFNHNIADVAATLRGHVVRGSTTGGIGIIVSDEVHVTHSGHDNYGERHHETDHPAIWCDIDDITTPRKHTP